MTRGWLGDEDLKGIAGQLPDLSGLRRLVLALDPEPISMKFPHESTVPGAAVCFADCMRTLDAAGYALHEAFAERMWYEQRSVPLKPVEAIFFAQFYADDCALRLYAAGEQLADAIIAMREIPGNCLAKFKDRVTSRQATLGLYLRAERPDDPVTAALRALIETEGWKRTRDYRDSWVHDQPPRLQGIGHSRRRGARWTETPNGWAMGLGVSDPPDLVINDLLEFVQAGLAAFATTFPAVLYQYLELLATQGITVSEGKAGESSVSLSVQLS